MGRPAGWMQKLTGRGAMRSPSAPSLRREVERQFWEQIATLECELIDRRSWKTHTEARLAIFTWIEAWYNPHRRHSSLG